MLGSGLSSAGHNDDALSVKEAELAMLRRLGGSENDILVTQSNLANTYQKFGRLESALQMRRDVYSGWLKLYGEEHEYTLIAVNNYAESLNKAKRFDEAKALLRKVIPVARRILGESDVTTLRPRWTYAVALCNDPGATLDDLREAVTTLEDAARVARRVLGGANPLTEGIEGGLRDARNARKTALADALADMRLAGFGVLMCHEKLNLQAR